MDIQIDPAQIETLGRLKWEENLRFRDWLKIQNTHQVESSMDAVSLEIAKNYDCTKCGNCCKALSIAPSPQDVRKLAGELKMSPFEFKNKYLKKDHEGDLVFKQRPCPFLKKGKCSVYEVRPETCRSYPHLEKNHMQDRGWHIVNNTIICPIVYMAYEKMKIIWRYRDKAA